MELIAALTGSPVGELHPGLGPDEGFMAALAGALLVGPVIAPGATPIPGAQGGPVDALTTSEEGVPAPADDLGEQDLAALLGGGDDVSDSSEPADNAGPDARGTDGASAAEIAALARAVHPAVARALAALLGTATAGDGIGGSAITELGERLGVQLGDGGIPSPEVVGSAAVIAADDADTAAGDVAGPDAAEAVPAAEDPGAGEAAFGATPADAPPARATRADRSAAPGGDLHAEPVADHASSLPPGPHDAARRVEAPRPAAVQPIGDAAGGVDGATDVAPGTSAPGGAPATGGLSPDTIARVLEIVDRQAEVGPRRVVIDADDLRLAVSVRGDQVRVSVLGDSLGLPPRWSADLEASLSARGFSLSSGRDDRGSARDDRGAGRDDREPPSGDPLVRSRRRPLSARHAAGVRL